MCEEKIKKTWAIIDAESHQKDDVKRDTVYCLNDDNETEVQNDDVIQGERWNFFLLIYPNYFKRKKGNVLIACLYCCCISFHQDICVTILYLSSTSLSHVLFLYLLPVRFPLRKWYCPIRQSGPRADEVQVRWKMLCCAWLYQAGAGELFTTRWSTFSKSHTLKVMLQWFPVIRCNKSYLKPVWKSSYILYICTRHLNSATSVYKLEKRKKKVPFLCIVFSWPPGWFIYMICIYFVQIHRHRFMGFQIVKVFAAKDDAVSVAWYISFLITTHFFLTDCIILCYLEDI